MKACCETLQKYMDFTCEACGGEDCPDNPFHFGQDIGIRIQDGGTSYLLMKYCCFCGGILSFDFNGKPGERTTEK